MSFNLQHRTIATLFAVLVTSLMLGACSGSATATPTSAPAPTNTPTTTIGPSGGTVDVRVTDAADGDITAIVITGSGFRVSKSNEDGASDWVTVLEGERTFDLLKVVGKEESLGVAELEPGSYNQIRMDVVKAIITMDGQTIEATVPSAVLRIVRPFTVVAGEETILTFDFDADRSVTQAGQRLQFKPTVKLLVRKGGEPFVPESSASPTLEPTATPAPTATLAPTATPTPSPTATPTPSPTPTPAPDQFVLNIIEPVDTIAVQGQTRADAVVSVNDAIVEPDIDGNFSSNVTLAEGANVIEVVASIGTGEELSKVFTVIYLP